MISLLKFEFYLKYYKKYFKYGHSHFKTLLDLRGFCTKDKYIPRYMYFDGNFLDETEKSYLINHFKVIEDFLNEKEEASLVGELDNQLKSRRYERSHWDDAITGYREIEKLKWNYDNTTIINKFKETAFKTEAAILDRVHILDLEDTGIIKPHIDSIKFCGEMIAGISLLSDSVMRLIHNEDKSKIVDVLLKRRSLYMMSGIARYNYTHEILGNENSKFGDQIVKKGRRISVICRNKPT